MVKYWSFAIASPDLAFLNVDVPGPVMIRVNSSIDGVNGAASTPLELGRDYQYTIVCAAGSRAATMSILCVDVHDAGALMGPGDWVTVSRRCVSVHRPGEYAQR